MDSFLQSLFTPRAVVLGKKLQPLSAWHCSMLLAFKSPFMEGGNVSEGDVVMAAHIMSEKWPAGMDAITAPDAADLTQWGARVGKMNLEAESAVLSEHILAYLTNLPELWKPKDGKSTPSGIPWPFQCVSTVLQNMHGLTEDAAWNMPVNRLIAYRAAIAESNGHEIVSEKQRESMRLLKEESEAANG